MPLTVTTSLPYKPWGVTPAVNTVPDTLPSYVLLAVNAPSSVTNLRSIVTGELATVML